MVNHVFYRISSSSYVKGKLPGATKEVCLHNFLECFPTSDITLIADNCDKPILDLCSSTTCKVIQTSLGNAGSFRYAVQSAMELPDDFIVYFVEDDYLHLKIDGYYESIPDRDLEEGLLRADYVTLYDHPDKYLSEYGGGEMTKVYRTLNSHWKNSISTTMTFATRVRTLREDLEIWNKFTEGKHPEDHLIFSALNKKGRLLGVRIPGSACHVDMTYSLAKSALEGSVQGNNFLEPWVFLLIEKIITKNMLNSDDVSLLDNYCPKTTPRLKRLMIISSLANLVRRNS